MHYFHSAAPAERTNYRLTIAKTRHKLSSRREFEAINCYLAENEKHTLCLYLVTKAEKCSFSFSFWLTSVLYLIWQGRKTCVNSHSYLWLWKPKNCKKLKGYCWWIIASQQCIVAWKILMELFGRDEHRRNSWRWRRCFVCLWGDSTQTIIMVSNTTALPKLLATSPYVLFFINKHSTSICS